MLTYVFQEELCECGNDNIAVLCSQFHWWLTAVVHHKYWGFILVVQSFELELRYTHWKESLYYYYIIIMDQSGLNFDIILILNSIYQSGPPFQVGSNFLIRNLHHNKQKHIFMKPLIENRTVRPVLFISTKLPHDHPIHSNRNVSAPVGLVTGCSFLISIRGLDCLHVLLWTGVRWSLLWSKSSAPLSSWTSSVHNFHFSTVNSKIQYLRPKLPSQ